MNRSWAGLAAATFVWGLSSAFAADAPPTAAEPGRVVDLPTQQPLAGTATRPVFRQEVTTETREMLRTRWEPVTDWTLESRWVNRYNPFAEPYLEHRYVPRTRWQAKTDVVRVPVECRRLVPEIQPVRVAEVPRTGRTDVIPRGPLAGMPSPRPIDTTAGTTSGISPTPPDVSGSLGRPSEEPPRLGQRPNILDRPPMW
jgi:hypothetical protein